MLNKNNFFGKFFFLNKFILTISKGYKIKVRTKRQKYSSFPSQSKLEEDEKLEESLDTPPPVPAHAITAQELPDSNTKEEGGSYIKEDGGTFTEEKGGPSDNPFNFETDISDLEQLISHQVVFKGSIF